MTVPNTAIRSGPFFPNGSTVSFPFTFRALDKDDVQVFRLAPDGSVLYLSDALFDVALTVNGGSVLFATAPIAGDPLYIGLDPAFSQEISFENEGAFLPEVLTEALDRGAQRSLWLRDRAIRSVVAAPGDAGFQLPSRAVLQGRGAKVLGTDPSTGGLTLLDRSLFKGDVGGNVMSIGAFVDASGMNIPPEAEVVQTSRFKEFGSRPSLYFAFPGLTLDQFGGKSRFADDKGRVFALVASDSVALDQLGPLVQNDGTPTNVATLVQTALQVLPRTSPPGFTGRGVGEIIVPKANWRVASTVDLSFLHGGALAGCGPFASNFNNVTNGGTMFLLKTTSMAKVSDLSITDSASIGRVFKIDGTGGGGPFLFERINSTGRGTFIENTGVGYDPGNGDKGLVYGCDIGHDVFYDQARNNQAIGWFFFNNGCGSYDTHFLLGGAGQTHINTHTGDISGSLMRFPESSGNPGLGDYPNTVQVTNSKFEFDIKTVAGVVYDQRLLIDASQSKSVANNGPQGYIPRSNFDVSFTDVWYTGGRRTPGSLPDGTPGTQEDRDNHVIVRIGADGQGTAATRVRQVGGWIEGAIVYNSSDLGTVNKRWSFGNAMRAPKPEKVQLLGPGFHPLMEWRANENVPVDQYRGGQSFVGTIEAEKAFLWRQVADMIVDTRVAGATAFPDGTYGWNVTLGGFAPGSTVTGLELLVVDDGGTATGVNLYTDNTFSTVIGFGDAPGGSDGLVPIIMYDPSKRYKVKADGNVYIRVIKGAQNRYARGAVVIRYFPYGGK